MRCKVAGNRYTYGMTTARAFDTGSVSDTIASNLRAELSRQRWSGRKAAIALGVKPLYVNRRANGEVELSGSDLVMFATLLNVPISRFFEGTTKTPAATNGDGGQVGPGRLELPTSTVEYGRFGHSEPVEQDVDAVVTSFEAHAAKRVS